MDVIDCFLLEGAFAELKDETVTPVGLSASVLEASNV